MASAYLAPLLFVLASIDISYTLSEQSCCSSWVQDGWMKLGELPALAPEACCEHPRHFRFRAGQEMKLKWSPGHKENAVGVSFCNDSRQLVCYALDMWGEINRQLHFQWRKHSFYEKGFREWVPGKAGRFPGTIIKGDRNKIWHWSADRMQLTILLKRAFDGKLTVKVEGGDPIQSEKLMFDLEPEYDFGAVDIFYRQKKGATVDVLGPCFNGELFGYHGETCTVSVDPIGILRATNGDPQELWVPQPGRWRAKMTSLPFDIPAGSDELCVSVSLIASKGARMSIYAVPASGNITRSFRLAKLLEDLDPAWTHDTFFYVRVPRLRTGPIRLVITVERDFGSLLILQSVNLCGRRGDAYMKKGKGKKRVSLGRVWVDTRSTPMYDPEPR